MNDERKPRRDSGGHITIPPELRPFSAKPAAEPERARVKGVGSEAILTQLAGELGDESKDTQEIDPTRGVGNLATAGAMNGLPAASRGKVVTAKVKIEPAKAKSDPPAPLAASPPDAEGSPWAKALPMAPLASELPSSLLPKPAEAGGVVESKRPEDGEKRRGLAAIVIGAALLVLLGVVTMIKLGAGPTKVGPAVAGVASAPDAGTSKALAPAPSESSAPSAPPPATTPQPEASGVPSAEPVVPSAPSSLAPSGMVRPKPKDEDPYDAAPAPATATPHVTPTKPLVEDRPVF
jgi:hypothetical protein